MHKVNSAEELARVLYKVQADAKAHVWVRGEGTQREETEEGPGGWDADETYFYVTAENVSMAEIEADVDFWLEKMGEAEGECGDGYGVEAYRQAVRRRNSEICAETIVAGTDVELSDGVEHFSLTQNDQTNLIGLQSVLAAGAEKVPYHKDRDAEGTKPCVYYSAADAEKIIQEVMSFKTFHTTYCNSLFCWLDSMEKASDMDAVVYGAEIPEEYQSEVLKDILGGMG